MNKKIFLLIFGVILLIGILSQISANMWISNNEGSSITRVASDGSMTNYTTYTNPVGSAYDNNGSIWFVSGLSITKMNIVTAATTNYSLGFSGFAVAFDGINMWTTNSVLPYGVTKITPTGAMTNYTGTGPGSYGIAFDGINMWTTNSMSNSVTKVFPNGSMINYTGTGIEPYGIAFDGVNMWVSNGNAFATGGYGVTKITPTGAMTNYTGAGNTPQGITYDQNGNMWISNKNSDSVTKINTITGTATNYTTGVGTSPIGIAYDNNGSVWTANYRDGVKVGNTTKINITNAAMISYAGTGVGSYYISTDISTGVGGGSINIALISPANATNLSQSSIPFNANFTIGTNLNQTFRNATWNVYNATSGQIINSTNVVFSPFLNNTNYTLIVNNLPLGTFTWNVNGTYANNTFANWTISNNFTFQNLKIVEVNQTYSSNTLSGTTQEFILNFSLYPSYQISTATFYYNNLTNVIGTITNLGNNVFLAVANITTPSISVPINETFYWNILLSDGSSYTSNSYNQTLNPFTIDNCTSNTQVLYNFSMFDEENLTIALTGTINALIQVYNFAGTSLIATYNGTFNYNPGTLSEICISNMTGNPSPFYKVSYLISYAGNSSYFPKYKTRQLDSLTNANLYNNITLYDLLAADGYVFQMNVVGDLQSNQAGVLVDVQKLYIPNNQYFSVESATTDQSGIMIAHLIPNTAIYNFVISQNGTILGTITNEKAYCANPSAGCPIYLNVQQLIQTLANLQTYGNVSGGYSFDNATQTVTFTFFTTDNLPHNLGMNIFLDNGYSNVSVCSSSLYSTAGLLSCIIKSSYSGVSFYSEITSDGNIVEQFTQFWNLNITPNYYGVDILISLLLFTCIVMMMLSHPVMIVLGAILGLFFSALLIFGMGGTFLNISLAIGFFCAAGVILLIRYSKRRDF